MTLQAPPEALLTNVPVSFFADNHAARWGRLSTVGRRMVAFKMWYLEQSLKEGPVFYHFISSIPVQKVDTVFICWGGRVQVKCWAKFLKGTLSYEWAIPMGHRCWMITHAPIEAPPHKILQPGFRGFRYTKMLF